MLPGGGQPPRRRDYVWALPTKLIEAGPTSYVVLKESGMGLVSFFCDACWRPFRRGALVVQHCDHGGSSGRSSRFFLPPVRADSGKRPPNVRQKLGLDAPFRSTTDLPKDMARLILGCRHHWAPCSDRTEGASAGLARARNGTLILALAVSIPLGVAAAIWSAPRSTCGPDHQQYPAS